MQTTRPAPMFARRFIKLRSSLRKLPAKARSIRARWEAYSSSPHNCLTIAFWVSGGMGDHIMAARYVRDLTAHIGEVRFDVYCARPPLGEWVFGEIPGRRLILDRKANIKTLQREYRCVIDVLTFAAIRHENPRKRLDNDASRRLDCVIKSILARQEPLSLFTEHHPRLDGYLGYYSTLRGYSRHNFLHWMSGIAYTGDLLDITASKALQPELEISADSYITINNGYDEQTAPKDKAAAATKVYPHFADVVRIIKSSFPFLSIIQIGGATSTRIDGVDLDLTCRTTLPEASEILRHSSLHIDIEGGLVHLARAVGTTSCVIFGPTLARYFAYPGNINIEPQVCGGCWWMERTWMERCAIGEREPPCMFTQSPESVANRVIEWLSSNLTEEGGGKLRLK